MIKSHKPCLISFFEKVTDVVDGDKNWLLNLDFSQVLDAVSHDSFISKPGKQGLAKQTGP